MPCSILAVEANRSLMNWRTLRNSSTSATIYDFISEGQRPDVDNRSVTHISMLSAPNTSPLCPVGQVRRQIMEQDEVYHRAVDEAGRKIRDSKDGVGADGRPLADTVRMQRQAIQDEQARRVISACIFADTTLLK